MHSEEKMEPGEARRCAPDLPPGLEEGGSWLPVIRAEVRKELAIGGAYAKVLRRPPLFLRWLLKPWLHL